MTRDELSPAPKSEQTFREREKCARIGAILATCNQQDDTFLLNRKETERLRTGKSAAKVDQIFVVAIKSNGDGRREHICHEEADVLWERIQHKPTIDGRNGPFWSLTRADIEGDDAVF